MTDCMVDLETMDSKSNAAIIAIGAVKFDPKLRQITDRFYTRVDLQSCMDVGLTVSGDTIMWWLQQSEAARAEFKGTLPSLKIALNGFTAWLSKAPSYPGTSHRVWGNGATFDNVILGNAYNAMKMERPWSFKGDRCYRTIKALYPDVPLPVAPHLVAHRADHDAEYQAIHLMEIWPKMRQNVAAA